MNSQTSFAAIDVGATKIHIAFFSALDPKSLISETRIDTTRNFLTDSQHIEEALKAPGLTIEAIACALPGFIINEKKGVVSAANLPDWKNKDLRSILASAGNTEQIFLLHDGKAHAMAEAVFTKNKTNFLFLAWGSGIGGTYIRRFGNTIDAQQVEFGYHFVRDQYIEALVGGINLEKRFEKKPPELSPEDWNTITDDFATGLANIMALNYPPHIIWGGSVALKNQDKIQIIMDKTHQKFPDWPIPSHEFTSFGDQGAVVGALAEIKYRRSL